MLQTPSVRLGLRFWWHGALGCRQDKVKLAVELHVIKGRLSDQLSMRESFFAVEPAE